MKRLECGVFWILLATILFTGLPVFATTQTETDLATWQAALSNIYTYQSFDTLTEGSYANGGGLLATNTSGNGMVDVRLIAFYGTDHTYNTTLQVWDELASGKSGQNWGATVGPARIVRGQDYWADHDSVLRILFTNSSIYAVFLDVMIGGLPDLSNGSASLVASTGPVTTVTTYPRPTRSYIGVLSDVPITYLEVLNVTTPGDATGTYAIIDNVYYSTEVPTLGGGGGGGGGGDVPEPITLLLIGSGLVAFRIMRRFQHRLA